MHLYISLQRSSFAVSLQNCMLDLATSQLRLKMQESYFRGGIRDYHSTTHTCKFSLSALLEITYRTKMNAKEKIQCKTGSLMIIQD